MTRKKTAKPGARGGKIGHVRAAPPPLPPPPPPPPVAPPPPAPAPPAKAAEAAREAPAEMRALGEPPKESTLEGAAWLRAALLISAHEAINDPQMKPSARRRELREISGAYERLEDKAELDEVRRMIIGDRKELEEVRSSAKLEPRAGRAPAG